MIFHLSPSEPAASRSLHRLVRSLSFGILPQQSDFLQAPSVAAMRRILLDLLPVPGRGKVAGVRQPERLSVGTDELRRKINEVSLLTEVL